MAKQYQNKLQLDLHNSAEDVIKLLPDFSRKYFDSLKNRNMSERTRLQYAYDIKKFFEFMENQAAFKDKNLKTMTAREIFENFTIEDINEYVKSIETVTGNNGEQYISSPEYKARKLSSLKSFIKYYYKIGDIDNSVADLIESPKIPDKNIVVMDKKDVERILKVVSTLDENASTKDKNIFNKTWKRDYAIMTLFLGTGLRVSELVGIDMSDIDFYNASIVIVRKGGDEDEVFFGAEVEKALKEYINSCRENLIRKNPAEQALFVSKLGERISVRSIEKMVSKYSQKAGINNKITPHALRRTYGTNLYEETNDIYLVADALHHSSVETTKKHYAKMSSDHKRKAAKSSSSLFNK